MKKGPGVVGAVLLLAASAAIFGVSARADVEHAAGYGDDAWVVLTIGHVRVNSIRRDGKPWDKMPPHEYGVYCKSSCKWVGAVVPGASGKLAKWSCELVDAEHHPACQPGADLFVRVLAGNTDQSTRIAPHTMVANFNAQIVVPFESLPPEGLQVYVGDHNKRDPLWIGGTWVTRASLQWAVATGSTFKIDQQSAIGGNFGSVNEITMRVSRYVPATR